MGDIPSSYTPPNQVRPWIVWTLLAAVSIVSLGATWLALDASNGADPTSPVVAAEGDDGATSTPTPSPSEPPTPTPEPAPEPGELTASTAKSALNHFLGASTKATTDPGDGLDALAAVARGPIVEEIANEQAELAGNGWSRVGTATVASLTVTAVDPDAEPPTATVSACIDSSDVVLLDADGEPIISGTPADQRRAINIYTLQRVGDSWLISDRTFPDQAAC